MGPMPNSNPSFWLFWEIWVVVQLKILIVTLWVSHLSLYSINLSALSQLTLLLLSLFHYSFSVFTHLLSKNAYSLLLIKSQQTHKITTNHNPQNHHNHNPQIFKSTNPQNHHNQEQPLAISIFFPSSHFKTTSSSIIFVSYKCHRIYKIR